MTNLILNCLSRLHKDEAGQGIVEYMLIIALVAFAATAGMSSLASGANSAMTKIRQHSPRIYFLTLRRSGKKEASPTTLALPTSCQRLLGRAGPTLTALFATSGDPAQTSDRTSALTANRPLPFGQKLG